VIHITARSLIRYNSSSGNLHWDFQCMLLMWDAGVSEANLTPIGMTD